MMTKEECQAQLYEHKMTMLDIGEQVVADPEWRARLRHDYKPGQRFDCPGEDFLAVLKRAFPEDDK